MDKKIYRKIVSGFTPTPNFIKKVNLVWGFTLIELMVTISIFLVITTTVIFNYGDFKSSVSLQNNTDSIALSIRKAQSYAIGAKGSGGVFSNSYGIHFSIDENTPSNPQSGFNKSFILFSTNNNKLYDVANGGSCSDSSANECRELFSITSSDKIKEIWVDGDKTNPTYSNVDIVFTRPEPRAYFCYRPNVSTSTCTAVGNSSVSIVISNGQTGTREKTKTITVQNTGQISVQ